MVIASLLALLLQVQAPALLLAPGETLLEVQAEGQATYAPDTAFISAGVVSTGTTARAATDANARVMTDVIAAIGKAGVEPRYIRTRQITVEPRFAQGSPTEYEGQARITGYVARNSVAVTVRKLSIAPDVIAAAFAAGANSVSGPDLASHDPSVGLGQARTNAVAAAKAEADAYAKSLGLRVARVLRVSERGNAVQSMDFARSGDVTIQSVPAPPPTPVMGGDMERTITVWIDFALTK